MASWGTEKEGSTPGCMRRPHSAPSSWDWLYSSLASPHSTLHLWWPQQGKRDWGGLRACHQIEQASV